MKELFLIYFGLIGIVIVNVLVFSTSPTHQESHYLVGLLFICLTVMFGGAHLASRNQV